MADDFKRRWWPGKGKPGEPKLTKLDLLDMIQSYLPSALEEMYRLLVAPDTMDWARLQITQLFMEYTFGKPSQAITGADGGPIKISIDELHKQIQQIVAEESAGELGPHITDAELLPAATAGAADSSGLREDDEGPTGSTDLGAGRGDCGGS